jgi:hypothetical protein
MRYVLSLACLLLLLALVPPQPAYSHGDPDEVVERTPPPPVPVIPGQWPTPGMRGGDPDELPDTELFAGYPDQDVPGAGNHIPGQPWWLTLRTLWIAWTSIP